MIFFAFLLILMEVRPIRPDRLLKSLTPVELPVSVSWKCENLFAQVM